MQISNQTLLFVGLGAILVWYFFLRKDEQKESNYRNAIRGIVECDPVACNNICKDAGMVGKCDPGKEGCYCVPSL